MGPALTGLDAVELMTAMTRNVLLLAAALVLADVASAAAQQGNQEGSSLVWNSAGSGALASRAPGHLMDNGMARYKQARARLHSWPEITQAPDDPNLKTQIKIIFIRELFQNLNTILLALDNAMRTEAGLAPYVPAPITPSISASLL